MLLNKPGKPPAVSLPELQLAKQLPVKQLPELLRGQPLTAARLALPPVELLPEPQVAPLPAELPPAPRLVLLPEQLPPAPELPVVLPLEELHPEQPVELHLVQLLDLRAVQLPAELLRVEQLVASRVSK